MDDKKEKRLSRGERFRSIDPGGSNSRKTRETNRISTPLQRTSPRRSEYRTTEERVITRDRGNTGQVRRSANRTRISRPRNENKSIWTYIIKYGLYLISVAIIFTFLLFTYWIYQAPEFDPKILDNNNKTTVYDVNGKEVAKLGNKIGDNAAINEVPKGVQDAILATEDNRFFEHGAVDYKRLVGAVVANVTNGFGAQGASTISQQLIKRTFLDDDKNLKRKIQEAYLAYKLEQNYDKETIFNMYINRIYYSDGVYGLKTAANYYYGKELDELELHQIALLAGMPQQPNGYNPYDYPEKAKNRRNTVLHLMQYHGKITQEEAKAAESVDILDGIIPRTKDTRYILSSEFDPDFTAYMSQVEYELRHSEQYAEYEGDVLNLGLKVYTNLNPAIQTNLSNSMDNNLAGIKRSADVAMVVLNNENSGVAAIYGGRNFKFGGFNYATQSKLQPGSAIKPILAYAPAVEYLNWSTNHMIDDNKIPGTEIQNWNRRFHGNVTINYALAQSLNIPAIKTYQEVGFENVKKYGASVGLDVTDESITTPIGGSADGYSPLQMAAAYVPFSNGGYYSKPKVIRQVFDSSDTEIKSFANNERTQVIKESTAYIITAMLRNVLGGTGANANIPGLDMGAKTGTTTFSEADAEKFGFDLNNYSKDSWIVGYTSQYTLAVWQGFDAIDAADKFMTSQDGGKTQSLYRINMQSIARLSWPKPFTVPANVGVINGGLKVLTQEEKTRLAQEAARKAEEEKKEAEERTRTTSTSKTTEDEEDSRSRTNSVTTTQAPRVENTTRSRSR